MKKSIETSESGDFSRMSAKSAMAASGGVRVLRAVSSPRFHSLCRRFGLAEGLARVLRIFHLDRL
jgi:hypothetical protein